MMDVQLMRLIVDEVELGTMPRVSRMAAERWTGPAGADELVYVRSSANHLFRFSHEGGPCFLRLTHIEERHASTIAAELDFVRHVAGAGLAVARPVPSTNGLLIEEVSAEGQRYHAVAFEGLRGDQLEVDDLDEARFLAWGSGLALVHQASQTFPPARRPGWYPQAREVLRTLPSEETEVARVITSGLRWLETLPISAQDYGLIHGDFELDNIIWDGQRVQALDFDDASYGWYGLDIAIALQDVWKAGDEGDVARAQRDERFRSFAEGYATVRPLPLGIPDSMPRLLNLLLAVKTARLLRAYANAPESEDPEWLARMRARHERWLSARRAELRWE